MSFTLVPAAGAILNATTLSALITELRPVEARRTSDSSAVNNSTAFVNDSALFVPVAASTVYDMSVHLRYNSGTTPDIKFGWTFPAGLTMRYDCLIVPAGSAALAQFQLVQTDPVACEGSTTGIATFAGLVIVGGTAGTLQLQFAQNTANVSNTVISAGSYMVLRKVE